MLSYQKPNSNRHSKNRFGGESCTLPAFAIAVYDVIIGSEMLGDYQTVRDGLDGFLNTSLRIHGSVRLVISYRRANARLYPEGSLDNLK